jgi:hypothetical protein
MRYITPAKTWPGTIMKEGNMPLIKDGVENLTDDGKK